MSRNITISTSSSGGIIIDIEGVDVYRRSNLEYSSNKFGVYLFSESGKLLAQRYPESFTINGESSFTSNEQVCAALDKLVRSSGSGVAGGCIDAELSDTVDSAKIGWIEPRLLAGDIKFTDEYGNTQVRTFELKELSRVRVKRVWSTGTTPSMGIVIYY